MLGMQALIMAPLFVYIESLLKLGFLKELYEAVNPVVLAKVRELNELDAKKKAK
jgi:uncharacterized membrane protein YGL010W